MTLIYNKVIIIILQQKMNLLKIECNVWDNCCWIHGLKVFKLVNNEYLGLTCDLKTHIHWLSEREGHSHQRRA